MIWVLIEYDNGHWVAQGIEGLRLHPNGHGTLSYTGTGVDAYERMQEDVMRYLKRQFPDDKLLVPMWLHTNHARSRLEQAEKEATSARAA